MTTNEQTSINEFFEIRIDNAQRLLLQNALLSYSLKTNCPDDPEEIRAMHDMLSALENENQLWLDNKFVMNDFTA